MTMQKNGGRGGGVSGRGIGGRDGGRSGSVGVRSG